MSRRLGLNLANLPVVFDQECLNGLGPLQEFTLQNCRKAVLLADSSSTNVRTVIVALVPRAGCGNSLPIFLPPAKPESTEAMGAGVDTRDDG